MSLLAWLFGGTPLQREPAAQAAAEAEAAKLVLYQFATCPYCLRVRRALRRLAVGVPLRDVRRDPTTRAELRAGGGRYQVPCLRIPREEGGHTWLYESADIVAYLERRFG